MSDLYQKVVQRNRGLITEENQAKLSQAVVAVAGCGADGGSPAISLARLGVRRFRLADPDTFDISNINRQEGAFHSSVGENKAQKIAQMIFDIQPDAEVYCYTEGITDANVQHFLDGSTILLEEVDYRSPHIALKLYQTARQLNIPALTVLAAAWNAFLFYFDPKTTSYEEYVGADGLDSLLTSKHISLEKFVPELPDYIPQELIQAVVQERIDIPVVDPGVRLASALLSAYTVFHITGMKSLEPVPSYYQAGDLLIKEPTRRS